MNTVHTQNVKRTYHKNGKLKMLKEYDDERRLHRMAYAWSPTGELTYTTQYCHGVENGSRFHERNNIVEKHNYVRNGVCSKDTLH